ncbi:MAG: hypothetical protein E3J35_02365 [Methanomassiliicoccales archaeon]|nr:MAG: hypothetical protein E3J35_02365 [Methanomassiliicoccales archaeon]
MKVDKDSVFKLVVIAVLTGVCVTILADIVRAVIYPQVGLLLYMQVPIWLIYVFLIIVVLLSYLVRKRGEKRKSFPIVAIGGKRKSPTALATHHKMKYEGVSWDVVRDVDSREPNRRQVFIYGGPYCPRCGCELDVRTRKNWVGRVKGSFWSCVRCGNTYTRPRNKTNEEIKEEARKIADAEIRERG